MAVRFLRAWHLYNPGETAGFGAEAEQALIEQGIAVDAAAPTDPAPHVDGAALPDGGAPKPRRGKAS